MDKTGTLHSGIGRIGFGMDKIRENFLAFFEAIMKAKPPASRRETSADNEIQEARVVG